MVRPSGSSVVKYHLQASYMQICGLDLGRLALLQNGTNPTGLTLYDDYSENN